MAIIGLVNDDIGVANDRLARAWFNMKEYLTGLAAPWEVVASGDGTTYEAAGDTIDSVVDMSTVDAWFVLSPPNGAYQLLFQNKSTSPFGRVSFSMSAGFENGGGGKSAASATQPWGAVDEHFIFGTVSSNGSYASSGSPTSLYQHVITSDTPVDGHYPLYILFTNPTQTSQVIELYGVDVLVESSRHPSHPKAVIAIESEVLARVLFYTDAEDPSSGVINSVDGRGRFARFMVLYNADGNYDSDIDDPATSGEIMAPGYWYVGGPLPTAIWSNAEVNYRVGMSRLLRQGGTTVAHNYPDRSRPAEDDARVFVNNSGMLYPWPTGVTPS